MQTKTLIFVPLQGLRLDANEDQLISNKKLAIISGTASELHTSYGVEVPLSLGVDMQQ